ncbi:ribose 5-phosphate isomerase A [Intestinibacillus sp. Marseille-P6563]|uniref:ribose 5-phosphate isomerase A n=1 Tax=Intestinibacillus sp. Marseille-P6563 TaxID=2364792 RepID=UPI000F05C49F|nr:ribose 5-phosphate isomerase A [Intestinibacillus sp. Marseille-P6563]
MNAKQMAGYEAAKYVKDGMLVGIGTGSTAYYLIEKLGQRMKEEGLHIQCVSTSDASTEQAKSLGIPLLDTNDAPVLDICIDGVDEVDPAFNGIKGGGGALFREKIVAMSAKYNIWICDDSKRVETIGAFGLPIEVLPFGYKHVVRKLEEAGFTSRLRMKDGAIYETNNHNYILDTGYTNTRFGTDYKAMEAFVSGLLGVLETGFFLNTTDLIISAGENGVTTIENKNKA